MEVMLTLLFQFCFTRTFIDLFESPRVDDFDDKQVEGKIF